MERKENYNLIKDKWSQNEKYILNVEKMYYEILASHSIEKSLELLKELYNYVKNISYEFYEEGYGFSFGYKKIKNYILSAEASIPINFILENKPIIKESNSKTILDSKNNQEVLTDLVSNVRNKLLQKINPLFLKRTTLEQCDLSNFCKQSSLYVKKYCQKKHLKEQQITIEPGFVKNSGLLNGDGTHTFNIVSVNHKKFIVDCSYSQFFLISKNLLERIGIPYLASSYVGIFMTMTESRRIVAEKILRDGWIEFTPQVLKDYLDGFALFYRNGLYYEKTKDFTYTTTYTGEDYLNFLNGKDNQLNYESQLVLGYQIYPLENPNLNFQKHNKLN